MQLRIENCDDAAFAKIVPLLRAEDVEEWRLFAGDTPSHLVRDGFKLPVGTGALTRIVYGPSGRPLVAYGVSPLNDMPHAPGWVWLVATDEAQRNGRVLHRRLQAEFYGAIVPLYARLVTASWAENKTHHEWLRRLGFRQAFVPWPMGVHQAPFIPFQYIRET